MTIKTVLNQPRCHLATIRRRKRRKKKKKKRLRTTDDVEGSEDEGAILSRNEIALDNNHYNINNVLVFEKPFHIKNSEWKLIKI